MIICYTDDQLYRKQQRLNNERSIVHGADVMDAAATAFSLCFSFFNGTAPHTNSVGDMELY